MLSSRCSKTFDVSTNKTEFTLKTSMNDYSNQLHLKKKQRIAVPGN